MKLKAGSKRCEHHEQQEHICASMRGFACSSVAGEL